MCAPTLCDQDKSLQEIFVIFGRICAIIYKSNYMFLGSLETFSTFIYFTGSDCKEQWTLLRDRYQKAKKRLAEKPSGSAAKKPKK